MKRNFKKGDRIIILVDEIPSSGGLEVEDYYKNGRGIVERVSSDGRRVYIKSYRDVTVLEDGTYAFKFRKSFYFLPHQIMKDKMASALSLPRELFKWDEGT